MLSVLLSLVVVCLLFAMGDGLRRWLAPEGELASGMARVVIGAWAGLVVALVVLTTLYHLLGVWPVRGMAWPVLSLGVGWSLVSWFGQRHDRRLVTDRFVWPLLVVPTVGLVLLSTPFLGLSSPAFYYANNGEYSTYALIADVVKHHALGDVAGGALRSRESVAGILCGFFSTLLRIPTLFLVQPFANAIGWLSFASLGVLFQVLCRDLRAGPLRRGAVMAIYGLAIVSAATQQLWTFSFLSQYLNTAIVFGLLAFLAGRRTELAPLTSRAVVAIGLALGAAACAYPDMLLVTIGLIVASEVAALRSIREDLPRLAASFAGAALVAALAGNRLAAEMIPQLAVGRLSVRAGWDIFGASDVRTLIGTLTGMSSLFYDAAAPGWLLTSVAVVALAAASIGAVRAGISTRHPAVARVAGLLAGYVLVAGVLFAIVIVGGRETNYVAVKFTVTFLWIGYLATAAAVLARPRSDSLTWVIIAAWAVLAVRVVNVADNHSQRLAEDAQRARFSLTDMREARALVGGSEDVAVLGTPWNLAVVGMFLSYGEDLLAHQGLRAALPTGTWVKTPEEVVALQAQPYAMTLGSPVSATAPAAAYHEVLRSTGFVLWARDRHPLKSVSASTYFEGDEQFAADKAFDKDPQTAWAAQGETPASLTLTPERSGVLTSIVLVARGVDSFLEAWQRVEVTRYRGAALADRETFHLSTAAQERRQNIELRPVEADRIELTFSDAVDTTIAGTSMRPAALNPGYAEIVLRWNDDTPR